MDDVPAFAQGQKLTPQERLVDKLARHATYVQEGQWQRNTSLFVTYVFCSLFGNTVLMLAIAVIHVAVEMIADRLEVGLAISRSLARQMGGDLDLVPSASGAVLRLVVPAPACAPPDPARSDCARA